MRSAIEAIAFDAYSTLFDVHSVVTLCDRMFPGNGDRLSRLWRASQLEYSWLRSLSGRYEDFWKVTESALLFARRTLGLACPAALRDGLMDAYLHLDVFHDVKPALSRLSRYKLVVLSNGSPAMLRAAVENAGLEGTFAGLISVDGAKIYKPTSVCAGPSIWDCPPVA